MNKWCPPCISNQGFLTVMDDLENPPRRIPDIRETAPQYENLIVDARLGHGGDEVEQPPLGEDSFESVNGREQEPESDFSLVREICEREILHWNYKGLKEIPAELRRFGGHMQELYLKENMLETLPLNLDRDLPFLSSLHLSRNKISELPSDFSRMVNLRLVDLSRNRLTTFLDPLTSLTALTTLDISHNQIKVIPESIRNLVNLEYFVAISNQIENLPAGLGRLRNLSGLYLSRNRLTEVCGSLSKCVGLQELYLDHNLLRSIPQTLVTLPRISLISLAGNLLTHLPHLPFVSDPRILLEDNPWLTYLPYVIGCQQTIINYSNQASWSALSQPLVENTFNGVWSVRVGGCPEMMDGSSGGSGEAGSLVVATTGRDCKTVHLPNELERVEEVGEPLLPSLLELSLKVVYINIWRGGIGFQSSVPSDIKTHVSSSHMRTVSAEDEISFLLELPTSLVQVLQGGPTTFCSSTLCSKPIFKQATLEIVPKEVQKSSWGSREPEITRILSTRLYCSSSCRHKYYRDCELPWEKALLNSCVPWTPA